MARYTGGIKAWWDQRKVELGRTDFGAVDYYDWLKENAPEDGSTGTKRWGDPDVTDLVWARNQFLNHLPNEELWEGNQRGKEGGLYARINHNIIQSWYTHKRGQDGVAERTRISEADYLAALAIGKSSWDVRNWLGEHKHVDGAEKIFDALTENRKINIEQLYKNQFGDDYTINGDKVQAHLDSGKGLWDLKGDIESEHQTYVSNQEQAEESTGDTGADNDSDFIIPGKGGAKFGHADYHYLLSQTDGSYEQLKKVRSDVLAWIQDHPDRDSILDGPNKPNYDGGSDDGLYEQMNTGTPDFDRDDGGRFSIKWGDPAIDIDKNNTASNSDILAWKAGGHSTFQIYSYMNRNKDTWKDSTEATQVYNNMRQELITRGNDWGNLHGNEDGKYSWKNTLENPLWQELGKYMKSAGVKDNKSVAWWMYDKDAYRETRDWLEERHSDFDWITVDDSGNLTKGPTTDAQLEDLIGSAGVVGSGGVGVSGDWDAGEYWQQWGTEGPHKDGESALADIQKISAGIGLGTMDITEPDLEDKLDALEERFLTEMYDGWTEWKYGKQHDEHDPKLSQAKDSWGLDIVRKDMNPEDWDEDWFDGDDMNNNWFQTLAYGGEESIDWAYYAENKYYKDAREALGMDEVIDTVKEIREANNYVYAAVLAGENSDHLEEWIPYEPTFDNNTPIAEPMEIDIGDYETPEKDEITPAPDRPDAPNINIPVVDVAAPENMPSDLKIAGGEY